METLMSKGPGRIERAIASIFDTEPGNAFTTEDLCERVYPGINRVEKKHRVAVLRAARTLMCRRDTLAAMVCENLGQTQVLFDCTNVMSYAMARLKCEYLSNYRSKNPRISRWQIRDEQQLRDQLSEPRRHAYLSEGGAWWTHVQSWTAELEARRAGDADRLVEVQRERDERNAKINRALGVLGAGIRRKEAS
jgi:hypothetical protein